MTHSILLVEDDPDVQDSVRSVLDQESYKIQAACNGKVALALLETGLRPDLILLDLMMPEMNGYEFLKHSKKKPEVSDIPVVLLSAATDVEAVAAAHSVRYLKKPFDLNVFLKTLKETFDDGAQRV